MSSLLSGEICATLFATLGVVSRIQSYQPRKCHASSALIGKVDPACIPTDVEHFFLLFCKCSYTISDHLSSGFSCRIGSHPSYSNVYMLLEASLRVGRDRWPIRRRTSATIESFSALSLASIFSRAYMESWKRSKRTKHTISSFRSNQDPILT